MRPQDLKKSERVKKIAEQVRQQGERHQQKWLVDMLGGSLSAFSSNLDRWHDEVRWSAEKHESPLLRVYMEHLVDASQQVNLTLVRDIFAFLGVDPIVRTEDVRKGARHRKW